MSQPHESIADAMLQIGLQVRSHRMQVFRESEQQFAERLSSVAEHTVTAEEVSMLETGDPKIRMEPFLAACQAMGVLAAVAEAAESKAALYLASVTFMPDIEEQIIRGIEDGEST